MIATAKIKEAERLLAEGKLSQRKIAQTVGISRASVSAIALGERPDYEAIRQAKHDELAPSGPVERCATCGGLVQMPCRLCHIRKMKKAQEEARRAARRKAREEATERLIEALRRARANRKDPAA